MLGNRPLLEYLWCGIDGPTSWSIYNWIDPNNIRRWHTRPLVHYWYSEGFHFDVTLISHRKDLRIGSRNGLYSKDLCTTQLVTCVSGS